METPKALLNFRVLSILLPAQICKFHKEVEVANKPGTYVVGPINSTEHLENGFYSMKLKSRANNEKTTNSCNLKWTTNV